MFNHTAAALQFDTPISGQGEIDVYSGTTAIAADNGAGFSLTRRDFDPFTSNFDPATETVTAGFSGFTNLYGGTLVLQNDFAIGASQVHAIGNATLGYGLNGLSIANPITVDGGVTLSLLADAGVSATQTAAIAGAGNIDKIGAGALTLTADNPITGQVSVADGVLALAGAGQVSGASRVVADGTFDISGVTSGASIRSLAGGGTVELGEQTLTLTAANDLFSGVIQGSGGLTLLDGVEALSGANIYSGVTFVDPGTLRAGAVNTFSPNSHHLRRKIGTS